MNYILIVTFCIKSIGCVKLQFYDDQNNQYIVTRSMEARMIKSAINFKSTDATISRILPDGTVSLDHKAFEINIMNNPQLMQLESHKNKISDLNTFVSNTLGVSKALLINVLFCHQEDSNWFAIKFCSSQTAFDMFYLT